MNLNLMQTFMNEIQTLSVMVLVVNAIIHLIFSGAVAKDAGQLVKSGQNTYLVSPVIWAMATLIGGVFVAAIYWFMHHLTLFRQKP